MSVRYSGPIALVLLDVDGVLTNGSLHFTAIGESMKIFNVRDGVAVQLLRAHGIDVGVVSGRRGEPLSARLRELAIEIAMTGCTSKYESLVNFCASHSVDPHSIAYVGDDIVDLEVADMVGTFLAPSDAHRLVLDRADFVLNAAGGEGVGREAAEHILRLGGLTLEQMYSPFVERMGGGSAG